MRCRASQRLHPASSSRGGERPAFVKRTFGGSVGVLVPCVYVLHFVRLRGAVWQVASILEVSAVEPLFMRLTGHFARRKKTRQNR
jgi:hypothetical protein